MSAKRYIFDSNQKKAAMQVSINSIMMGSLLFVLRFLWADEPAAGPLIMAQIVLAIPLLFVSSLANVKMSYWKEKEVEMWEALAWFTTNMGNIFVFNAIGLLTANVYPLVAHAYFILLVFLLAIYSVINVYYHPATINQKLFKFLFFVAVLTFGGIMHLPESL